MLVARAGCQSYTCDQLIEERRPRQIQAVGVVEIGVEPERVRKIIDGVKDPAHVIEGIVTVKEYITVNQRVSRGRHPR